MWHFSEFLHSQQNQYFMHMVNDVWKKSSRASIGFFKNVNVVSKEYWHPRVSTGSTSKGVISCKTGRGREYEALIPAYLWVVDTAGRWRSFLQMGIEIRHPLGFLVISEASNFCTSIRLSGVLNSFSISNLRLTSFQQLRCISSRKR